MSEPQEVILKGYANLPDGPSSAIGPEYREWLAVQHPDALDVLLYLEAEAGANKDNNPQPKVEEAAPAEPVYEAVEAPNNDPTPEGDGQEAEQNGY